MPSACGAHFSAFSRSVRWTTGRGFDQPCSTKFSIERAAAHPLNRGAEEVVLCLSFRRVLGLSPQEYQFGSCQQAEIKG